MEPVEVVITVNSPGEVAGWLVPMAAALEASPWAGRISVFIPPCTFASGSEYRTVSAMPQVDLAYGPGAFLRYVLLGIRPRGFHPSGRGVVLFLGGDLAYAALLAKRLRYPAISYTEGYINWTNSFARCAVPYAQMGQKLQARGVPDKKLRVVGNLMLDAAKPEMTRGGAREALGVTERPLLLLMPGSRPAHVEYMAPFYVQVAELVAAELPEAAIVLSVSPFVTDGHLAESLAGQSANLLGFRGAYTPGRMTAENKTEWESPGIIHGQKGLEIRVFRGRQYDLMAAADLALTLPGTNTMELSYIGLPMIVTVQLVYPERIPLEGLAGLVGNIPVLGKALKRRIIPKTLAKIDYTAWPNRLAGEFIIPEVRGRITPCDVSRVAVDLLLSPKKRLEMSARLKKVAGEPGASTRLASLIMEVVAERYGTDWRQFSRED